MGNVDSKGWTIPSFKKGLYVAANGNDSNPGTESGKPIRTLAHAAAISGGFDALLLRNGDIWNEPTPPKLGSVYTWQYNGPRAKLVATSASGVVAELFGLNPVNLQNLELVGNNRGPVVSASYVHTVLIEGCLIRNGTFGVTIQGVPGHDCGPATLRRNVILDNFNVNGDSSGVFVSYTNGGLVYDENVFLHNGWTEPGVTPIGYATVFNHNVYSHATNVPIVATRNVFALGSSHGLQARSGGIVRENMFYCNAIGLSYGLVNGGGELFDGGVSGQIWGNWFVGNKNITDSLGLRGTGMEIANVIGPLLIEGNSFYDDCQNGNGPPISLTECVGTYAAKSVGLHNVKIVGNAARNWPSKGSQSIAISGLKPGASGSGTYSELDYQSAWTGSLVGMLAMGDPGWVKWLNGLRAMSIMVGDLPSLMGPQLVPVVEDGRPPAPPAPPTT